jgi:caspase domain-containing protein
MRRSYIFVIGLIIFLLTFSAANAEKRVALVIGNGAYKNAPSLPNPPNDASDVAAALARSGFDVIFQTNLDQIGMQEASIRFSREARTADVALFYYSGHALQFGGVNYLVPVDAELRDEADLRRMARADQILVDLQQAKNLRILVLDSCRDNPFAEDLKRSVGRSRAANIGRGLAKMESPDGTIISYATQSGRTAEDGSGRNSPYTGAFLNRIVEKDSITSVFQHIGADVYENTRGSQVPELSLSFFGEYYLNGKIENAAAPASTNPDPCAGAADHWKSAETVGTKAAFEDHMVRFPTCAYAGLAKSRIAALTQPGSTTAPGSFDGIWVVREFCEKTASWPANTYQLAGKIKDGVFHFQFGTEGQPNSWTWEGKIEAEGSAEIEVKGLTGDPAYDVAHRPAGTPVHYRIALKLESSRGAGVRMDSLRPCRSEWSRLSADTPYTPDAPSGNSTEQKEKSRQDSNRQDYNRQDYNRQDTKEAKRPGAEQQNSGDNATAAIDPKHREPADVPRDRQVSAGFSCTKALGSCRVMCVERTGIADCASTVCVRLHQECLRTGCWWGKGYSGCGVARQ